MVSEHLLVVDKAASSEDDALSRPVSHRLGELPRDDAHDTAAVHDKIRGIGVLVGDGTRLSDGRDQLLHQDPAGEHRRLRTVPARRRTGDLVIRPGVLAQPHQPVLGVRHPARRLEQGLLERNAARAEPLEVLHAPVAVQPQLLLIGVRPERRLEEGEHVVRRVLEAARLLHLRAAAEVSSPPDCADVPPGPLDRSRTSTSAPAAAASYAAAAPASKPTTSTSHSWSNSTSAAATGSTEAEAEAIGVSPSSAG